MSRSRRCLQRSIMCFGVLCVFAFAPSRSDGCSCIPYTDWGFVSDGGTLPSNSRGLLWWGEFDGPTGTDAALPVQITTPSGEALPVASELVSKGSTSLWLFRPRDNFETGKTYVFTTKLPVFGHRGSKI